MEHEVTYLVSKPTFRRNLLSSPICQTIQHHTAVARSSVNLLLKVLYLYTYHATTHFLLGNNGFNGLIIEEETTKMVHLKYSVMWCCNWE
jgi:hypothetical protein